jgi:glycerate kinase
MEKAGDDIGSSATNDAGWNAAGLRYQFFNQEGALVGFGGELKNIKRIDLSVVLNR